VPSLSMRSRLVGRFSLLLTRIVYIFASRAFIAFSSMAVGEKRQLIIPARLGYGDRGAGGIIPGGAVSPASLQLPAMLTTTS